MEKKKFSISLTTQILAATVGGIIFGTFVGPWSANLKFIGDIFIRLIQMSVVLLVMSAVAAAVGSRDGQDAGKMGFHTFNMNHFLYRYFSRFRRGAFDAAKTGRWS